MVILEASTIHILVVDDVPDNLRLLSKILEAHNYVVRKSLSGRMAIQSALCDPPDVILLDINMPQMNGYDVCRQLRASSETKNIPIIFVSALDQIDHKIRAFEVGGQDYITKPFQEQEVLARIKNQLLIQHQRKQLEKNNERLECEIEHRKVAEAEVRRLNANLERQVQLRTLELQQSLKFESTLKRISDKVRDSLDQHQILQNVIEELAIALQAHCCDAVLYGPAHQSSLMRYQYLAPEVSATQEQLLYMADAPEIYGQLQHQKFCFAFCQLQPLQIHSHSSILACPIFDDQVDQAGILGELWVFRDTSSSFNDIEIHLVQQVANQCAIALRQAKLYAAVQEQVKELERLNQLKDDFLNTISHELRTPIASMKMVLNLLTHLTDQGHALIEQLANPTAQTQSVVQYFKVLQEECDRELALVEDLLSLQHIEAGTYSSQPTQIDLPDLLPYLIEPFEARVQNQQQTLHFTVDPTLPSLNLDPLIVNRVVTELLTNACKYTPSGETISLSVNLADDGTAEQCPSVLQLAVTNTGVEISPEEQRRIFDKFYRIPNNDPWKYGGTGLGLALVKKLVEQIGGSIGVDSVNQQTCFTVRLRLC